ncbi:MAG: hypothetical protein ACJAVX_002178 [Pseudoalteromonas rhizosphaerae]|jgi:hypothetical protein|uniref:Orphan protein n=1 Tax=Pseudoalteromonas neustonica TaxID=1840331 RepID=A0ABY3F9R1_9GAMM|nr:MULTISPECIES: hypothetical protein [Pseudoalteromonas]MBB1293344.1 hypothetical protein [Pseudoalteromonas sp. SR41-4]MBB1303153.1 hypothetical protein [Pseudoalteromonas sp. SR44-8]MBB1310402.1 hypothetical protein [Pseudoalteromonas sp. SR41-8]MBB1397721.1 hypothetical protein [Pseudoalteromonas sp. SG44-8]MBB1410072.1 hypothetical protein [Pseudoalteromonas sp. SG44-17]|tara:strand:- start:2137 stop:2802 length:666 start_codon:yes stop_codon:yes gene_type:complete
MSGTHNKAQLPSNPTLKEINWYKKQINWGELPPFYHLVASSVSESEGILEHGFDNAVKKIIDRRNWNLDLLGGHEDALGEIYCENKPRIALHQVFTDRGFELWALPYAKDVTIDKYVKDNRFIEFNEWDPVSMKSLIRINQLHKFIGFYFERGDKADKALILHAHKVVHKIISFLQRELNVVKLDGVTIKELYQLCERDSRACSDEIDIAKLMLGEDHNKE